MPRASSGSTSTDATEVTVRGGRFSLVIDRLPEHRWPIVAIDAPVDELLRAAASPERGGLVLAGPAGVGKTALAAAAVHRALAEGLPAARLVATAAGQHLPYGALGSFAALATDGGDRTGITEQVVRAVAELRAGAPHRPILAIDDAPLLDPASSEVLAHLVREGLAFLIATARQRVPLPAAFDGLLVEGLLHRIEVDPMPPEALRIAAEEALGGPLQDEAVAIIWEASRGVPLHARELVQVNVGRGLLLEKPEGWTFVDQPAAPPSLIDLVASRFASLDDDERRAFEALAIAQPLTLAAATDLAGLDLLASLEHAGMIVVDDDAGAPTVRLGHPLFDDVVHDALGPLQRRQAAQRAVTTLERAADDDPDVLLRATTLRMEHRLEIEPEQAVGAARRALALLDPRLAEDLVRTVDPGDFDGCFTLGTALIAQGRTDEADEILRRTLALARTDEERARTVSRRGNNLGSGGGRFADAIAVLDEGLTTIDDPHWRSFVAADLAYARSWVGQVDAADEALGGPDAKPAAVRANECLVGAVVAVMGGELALTERLVVEGLPLTPAISDDVPAARELLTLSRFLALAFGGDRRGADAVVTAELERARDRSTDAPGTWLAVRAIQRSIDGDIARALVDAVEAELRLAQVDVGGLRPLARAVQALALAQLGEPDRSLETAAGIDETWRDETKVRYHLAQAEAWRVAIAGDTRRGAQLTAAAGAAAIEANHVPMGAIAAYDAVRLGHPKLALPLLRDAASRWEGPLAAALLAHAEALAAERPSDLLDVASTLPDLGFTLAGAEAAAQAAKLLHQQGETAGATRAEFVASTLAGRLRGRRTPALGSPRGLTRRERQIAELAVAGRSAREIGADLDISPRTVENHLASAYRKLGVANRVELEAALADLDPAHPPA